VKGLCVVASITVDNVTIDFPIYGSTHQSLRRTLFARTGGLIRREGTRKKRVVVRALENVSFTLDHGDRLGLIGHNGAGKSTLLKTLAGVYWPDNGCVRVDGRISPLFTSAPGLDIEDTGYENIKTCGMFLGMRSDEIESKTQEIADFSELGDYLNLPVRTYSAGMVTRLSFAISTAIDPDILLLDEGLATGDARFAARADDRMQALIRRTGILVLASHSSEMIMAMCNRVALMEHGHLVAIGPAHEIIERFHRGLASPDHQESERENSEAAARIPQTGPGVHRDGKPHDTWAAGTDPYSV
jgi:ABC-type polysaccharide/polyol phosphate transport system ATPase subunit